MCDFNGDRVVKTVEFTVLQSLTPLGFERLSHDLRHDMFQPTLSAGADLFVTFVIVLQKILGLVGWFLMGLALRNLFKIK